VLKWEAHSTNFVSAAGYVEFRETQLDKFPRRFDRAASSGAPMVPDEERNGRKATPATRRTPANDFF
jgi:hypothetical protein